MGYFKWADQQLQELLAKNNSDKLLQYPKMQLGMANNTINSRMPGVDQYGRNIMSSGQTAFNNASKYATDASQLLGANAGIQAQTDQQLGDLQLQEADWKKFGLGNLNDAYAAMNEAENNQFQNEVSLKGAQAANKFAKRKALWNTVGGIANLGVQAAGMVATGGTSGLMNKSATALGGG